MKRVLLALLLAALCLLPAAALGEGTIADNSAEETMAEDITKACLLNGRTDMDKLRDGNHYTYWDSVLISGAHQLRITPPEGKALGALLVRWRSQPIPVRVQALEADGSWTTIATTEGMLHAQYIPLDHEVREVRIVGADNETTQLRIGEIRIMTPGRLPEDFPVWQLPGEKVDLLVLSAHPDDEMLWFGGLIPHYVAQGKQVLVACTATWYYHRRQELLDCLWTCGVRIQPIFLGMEDKITNDVQALYKLWGGQSVILNKVENLYRTYRPDVVALHDINGEYGHGVHKAISEVGRRAIALAADPQYLPEEAEALGVWDVPKVYVHLWHENQIQMDWHVPLDYFGGVTAQDMARQGFACHVSQQQDWQNWKVEDGGPYDNSLFGLYHTTVGPDEMRNDMFEHIN